MTKANGEAPPAVVRLRIALLGVKPAPWRREWCSGPEALDEIKAELLGLSYAEDLDLMVEFGRAVLDARDGKVRDALDAVGEDTLRRALDRQERREALLAGFDRRRTNGALARLGTPTAGATP